VTTLRSLVSKALSAETVVTLVGCALALMAGRYAGQGKYTIGIALAAIVVLAVISLRPRYLVTLGAFLMFVPGYFVGGIPLNEWGGAITAVAVLVFAGSKLRVSKLLIVLGPLFLSWATLVFLLHPTGDAGVRRLLHLIVWVLLAIALSASQVPRRPLAIGLLAGGVASIAGAVLFSSYAGRFGGLIGDPNTFVAILVIFTPIVLAEFHGRWARVLIAGGSATMVLATGSRTGVVALAAGIGVLILLPILRAWALWLAAGLGLLTWIAPEGIRTSAGYNDRAGSDALRERIQTAAEALVARGPWTGNGLSTARVTLDGRMFFFHNSYSALLAEIGLVGGAFYALIVVGALWQGCRNPTARGAVAGICAGLVTAITLGEVLLDLPIAAAIGLALSSSLRNPTKEATTDNRVGDQVPPELVST